MNENAGAPIALSGKPSSLAWMRLIRVFHKVDRLATQRCRCQGLSSTQFEVAAKLAADEGMTQQDLADRLQVTKGNVCQVLDRMERDGLLVRRQEGRANRLFLTDRGRELLSAALPDHEVCIERALCSLSIAEQHQLLSLLSKLDDSLT